MDDEHTQHDGENDPTETFEPMPNGDEEHPSPPQGAGGGFALVVSTGPRRGLNWPLPEGTTEAGRNPDAVIFLDDVTVSRHHAEFQVTDGHLWVRDMGSTNGTYVNKRRTDGIELRPGDEVIVGRFHLVVTRA